MKKDKHMQMRVDDEFVRKIDEWRRRQEIIPTRSQAVRYLIDKGLEAVRCDSNRAA